MGSTEAVEWKPSSATTGMLIRRDWDRVGGSGDGNSINRGLEEFSTFIHVLKTIYSRETTLQSKYTKQYTESELLTLFCCSIST